MEGADESTELRRPPDFLDCNQSLIWNRQDSNCLARAIGSADKSQGYFSRFY